MYNNLGRMPPEFLGGVFRFGIGSGFALRFFGAAVAAFNDESDPLLKQIRLSFTEEEYER